MNEYYGFEMKVLLRARWFLWQAAYSSRKAEKKARASGDEASADFWARRTDELHRAFTLTVKSRTAIVEGEQS